MGVIMNTYIILIWMALRRKGKWGLNNVNRLLYLIHRSGLL